MQVLDYITVHFKQGLKVGAGYYWHFSFKAFGF